MSKLKIYISSTFLDLQATRKVIIERIQMGLSDYFELTQIMEKMAGDPLNRSNEEVCIDEVRQADVYIILIGKRYGSHPKNIRDQNNSTPNESGKSYTELEYDAACAIHKEKFTGIYKFELTDEFFDNENILLNTDLDQPDRLKKFQEFTTRLNDTISPIPIKSLDQLEKYINNKLTEFYLLYNEKLEMNITPMDKASIDRKEQLNKIQSIELRGGACVLMVEAEDENDGYFELMSKLHEKLVKKSPDRNLNLISSGNIATSINQTDNNKILLKLLKESSMQIYNDYQHGITFEAFAEDLQKENGIRNVFIGFTVDCSIDMDVNGSNFLNWIAAYIHKMNDILIANNFNRYIFCFVIYINSLKSHTNLSKIHAQFEGVQYFRLGQLTPVEKIDVMSWLVDIKSKRTSLNLEVSDLFKMVFLSADTFPAKYKRVLELIDKRTK